MSAMDKVNNILGKLPFVKLAGKIPSGILGKIPVLNTLIPFANHIAVILAAVVLVAYFGGGGNSGGSGGGSGEAPAQVANGGEPYVIPASDFRYELSADGTGVTLLQYTGPGGNIVIPTEIEDLPIVESGIFFENVTSAVIPDYYLQINEEMYESTYNYAPFLFKFDETLESVTFPKGIKYIPDEFFHFCIGLKSFTIPDTVTAIAREAFYGSGLTSIVIPEGVTEIRNRAFEYCADLKSVTLPESIREIGESAFANCPNLETVIVPPHQIEFLSSFQKCPKLNLASQQALRNTGYTGTFN